MWKKGRDSCCMVCKGERERTREKDKARKREKRKYVCIDGVRERQR